ncbi:AtzG-like protein [Azorhizobium caulinodans]|uniref:AtzG-like protein n=1 Tax=Azorhizobium caulinodans TaxID=7 RepID=UPI002FBDE90A
MSSKPELPPVPDAALAPLLDGAIAAFSLTVEPDWHKEALANLRFIADAAHLVLSYELGDEAEPAAVYRP